MYPQIYAFIKKYPQKIYMLIIHKKNVINNFTTK